jgi:hypothetical protein
MQLVRGPGDVPGVSNGHEGPYLTKVQIHRAKPATTVGWGGG